MPRRFHMPEGASPLEDASGLIPLGILTYSDLCAAEAENVMQAVNKHLRRRKNSNRMWFTEEYLRKVHRDMFGDVWKWGGFYRQSDYNIGVSAHQIREEITKLCGDVEYWNSLKENSMSTLERTIRIHHRLAWIHPFPNGNGRHARLMADIFLFSYGEPFPIWPSNDVSAGSKTRKRYLEALRKADAGDFNPLIKYTMEYLPKVTATR